RSRAQRIGLREGRDGWMRLAGKLEEEGDPLAPILREMLTRGARLLSRKRTTDEFVTELGELRQAFGLKAPLPTGSEPSADAIALEQAGHVLDDIALSARL